MLAIRPPEYFPRLEYLALVERVDRFVLADTFEYSNRSFQNRSRLRNAQGWHWISVPLRGKQSGRKICDVEIENRERWLIKHWRAFQYNYRSTPYFEFYEPQLTPFFEREWTHLGALSCASVELLHQLLELPTELIRASELPGAPSTMPAVLDVLDAEGLVSPVEAAAHDAEIVEKQQVFTFDEPTYRQNFEGFEEGMSAADLIFNYGPESVSILQDHGEVRAYA